MAKNKNINIQMRMKGAKKTEREVKGVNSSLTRLAKSAGAGALAYFSARGLINAFKFVTEAAGEQERQEKKLETALGGVSTSLLTQASALQKVTTFGDEAIIGVQASIAMFTDNEEAIKRATIATLDMATATGMDLKSAGDLVAKTLGSSTNALSRYGIVVEGAVGSTERLDTLTKNIADKMGGQAAAAAETYLGQMEQLKNVFGDVAERMGSKLIPEITKFLTPLKDTMEMWLKYRDAVNGTGAGVLRLTPELRSMAKELEDQDILLQETAFYSTDYFLQLDKVKNLTKDYKIALDEYNKSKETEVNVAKELIEPFDAYILKQEENIALKAQEAEWIDVIIEMDKELAEQMGLIKEAIGVNMTIEDLQHAQKLQQIAEQKEAMIALGVSNVEIQKWEKQQVEQLEAAKLAAKLNTVSALTGALGQLNTAVKGNARVSKRLAQVTALIDTYAGANKALSASPPPFNFIAAAAVTVAGLANVANIESQKFATGGIVGGSGTSDTVPAMLTPGEFVMTKESVGRIGSDVLSGMNQGKAGGGITLNFHSPVTNADFVRDVIVPEIERARTLA